MNVSRALSGVAMRAGSRLVNPGGNPSDEVLRQAVEDKVVLVTGASHGIGRASAERLAGAGARVLAVARSEDELGALSASVAERGGDARAFPTDLTDLDA